MIKEMQLLIFIITHIQVGISILQIRYIHNSIMDIHNYRVCSLWLYCTYRLNNRADHLDGCHTDQLSNVTMLKVTKELCHVSTTKSALAFFTQRSCPTGKMNWTFPPGRVHHVHVGLNYSWVIYWQVFLGNPAVDAIATTICMHGIRTRSGLLTT